MAQFVRVLVAKSLSELAAATNEFLTTLLSHTIIGIQFVAGDAARYNASEYRIGICYKTGGFPIANPYQVVLFDGAQPQVSVTSVQDFMDTNPSWFFGQTDLQYITNDGRTLVKNPVLLPYNASYADGILNWAAGGGPVGDAGGDLTGAYPDPSVKGLWGINIENSIPIQGNTLVYNEALGKWIYDAPLTPGDVRQLLYVITTVDPTIIDDQSDGYGIGTRWVNSLTLEEFVLLDATVGAAVWASTTSGGGGGITSIPVKSEGVLVLNAKSLNFSGSGVAVADQGSGQALISISSNSYFPSGW
jgi:hypothetical protein